MYGALVLSLLRRGAISKTKHATTCYNINSIVPRNLMFCKDSRLAPKAALRSVTKCQQLSIRSLSASIHR
eukprot:3327484-Amphidinium_carterae.1